MASKPIKERMQLSFQWLLLSTAMHVAKSSYLLILRTFDVVDWVVDQVSQ